MFATRLTRLTRALHSRNPERAIQRAAATAPDWSSGTRIGDALKAFNDRHGRRGMARGAVVVILSDGWERGDPALVGREMERLSRLAYRIVWVNPRAAAAGFVPRAGGMAAALPYCDALVSGHSLRGARRGGGRDRRARRGRPRAAGRARRPTRARGGVVGRAPRRCPGSSVAMPQGYGPEPRAGPRRDGARGRRRTGEAARRRPRSASTRAASARRCRRTCWAGRSPASATWRSTTRSPPIRSASDWRPSNIQRRE